MLELKKVVNGDGEVAWSSGAIAVSVVVGGWFGSDAVAGNSELRN